MDLFGNNMHSNCTSKPLFLYRNYHTLSHANESVIGFEVYEHLVVSYDISLNHLIKLNENNLKNWEYNNNSEYYEYPLDALYSITHADALQKTKVVFEQYNINQIKKLKYIITGNGKCQDKSDDYNICDECHGKCCPFIRRGNINE